MEIRLGTNEDYDLFLELYTQFFEGEFLIEKDEFEKMLLFYEFYFATVDGAIIGYAMIDARRNFDIEICHFFVKYPKLGYGSMFYKILEEKIREKKISKIFLYAYWPVAQYFWTKMGYQLVSKSDEMFQKSITLS